MNKKEFANAIRFLSLDAVEEAKSGHPGAPMGMADIAYVLWKKFLQHNPKNPNWINRDRFVLSNGHGSMLLYSLLHLTGYNISIDDIQPEMRRTAKVINFGIMYGAGPFRISQELGISRKAAQEIIKEYFNQYSGIKE